MDRLNGLLSETDFERIYSRAKTERSALEEKLKELELQKDTPVDTGKKAQELVQRFLSSTDTNRELLVSLIERVELTEDKQIIIKFRFRELEAISYTRQLLRKNCYLFVGKSLTIAESRHI